MWFRRSLRYHEGRIEEPGGASPDGQTRIILLVHGYNNDKEEAEGSYEALMQRLLEQHASPTGEVWWFFWPSYVERLTGTVVDASDRVQSHEAGTESNSALSFPTYAWQVLKAREVGRELGRYLRDLHRREGVPTEVVFVAHSLGCRVVLEALHELLADSTLEAERDRVPCVCLMAAAVPTFMVEQEARLEGAAMLPQATYVLHSRSDLVLHWAFPGGQNLASRLIELGFGPPVNDATPEEGEGIYPEAVGRYGNPQPVWLRQAETGLGHSGYWTHPSTAPNVLRALEKRSTASLQPESTHESLAWTLPVHPDLPDWKNRETIAYLKATRRMFG